MDGDALEIGDRQVRVGEVLVVLRRSRAEDIVDVAPGVLELDIGHREGADVAAGAGERNPWRRMDLAALIDHLRHRCDAQIVGPVGEGAGEFRAGAVEIENRIADRHAHLLAIDAGERGQDIHRRVGDERRVMIGEQRALLLHEMQQIGHLLEIRRHFRIVAAQMDVVELDIDDVLDAVAMRSELAAGGVGRGDAGSQERHQRACGVKSNPVHLDSPMFCWIGARPGDPRRARTQGA
jgi:hypothetical protein